MYYPRFHIHLSSMSLCSATGKNLYLCCRNVTEESTAMMLVMRLDVNSVKQMNSGDIPTIHLIINHVSFKRQNYANVSNLGVAMANVFHKRRLAIEE